MNISSHHKCVLMTNAEEFITHQEMRPPLGLAAVADSGWVIEQGGLSNECPSSHRSHRPLSSHLLVEDPLQLYLQILLLYGSQSLCSPSSGSAPRRCPAHVLSQGLCTCHGIDPVHFHFFFLPTLWSPGNRHLLGPELRPCMPWSHSVSVCFKAWELFVSIFGFWGSLSVSPH